MFTEVKSLEPTSSELQFSELTFSELKFSELEFSKLNFSELNFPELKFSELGEPSTKLGEPCRRRWSNLAGRGTLHAQVGRTVRALLGRA